MSFITEMRGARVYVWKVLNPDRNNVETVDIRETELLCLTRAGSLVPRLGWSLVSTEYMAAVSRVKRLWRCSVAFPVPNPCCPIASIDSLVLF